MCEALGLARCVQEDTRNIVTCLQLFGFLMSSFKNSIYFSRKSLEFFPRPCLCVLSTSQPALISQQVPGAFASVQCWPESVGVSSVPTGSACYQDSSAWDPEKH